MLKPTTMTNQARTAEILVVRAVEERRPDAVPGAVIVDALAAAGDLDDERLWLWRRAHFLLDGMLASYRPLARLTTALDGGTAALLLGPLLIGLSSNYLGPTSRIHAVLNPIALLVVWNVCVYALLVLGRLFFRRRPAAAAPTARGATATRDMARTTASAPVARPRPAAARGNVLTRWALRRFVPGLWLSFSRNAGETKSRARDVAAVTRRFWEHWFAVALPVVGLSARRAFHLAAIGLAVGALAGLYVRGLFFDYNVVWRSTFVRDPNLVATLLKVLVGPAALAIGERLPDAAEAAQLMTPQGVPAARWIHLYAASAILLIVAPRLLLAIWCSLRRGALASHITVDLAAPYYQELLASARALEVRRVEEATGEDVRRECEQFARHVAAFVCEDLYDARVVPRLEAFRDEGGSIIELEEAIAKECRAFETKLARQLPIAQQDFERSLSRSIARTIGAELTLLTVPAGEIASGVGTVAADLRDRVAARLGHRFADVVGGAVSAALAVVTATISGGLGKTLGTAILVGLLGTSGPVGFVIGGIGGLALAGGAWWLGRDALAARFRHAHLPGLVARAALIRFGALVADGRRACEKAVRETIDRELTPLTPRIAEQIWLSVKPLLGEQHRRGTGEPA